MSDYDRLMEQMDEVNQYGGYFATLCVNPNHPDSRPSLMVYEHSDNENYEFYCRGCGFHGTHQYLLKVIGGNSYITKGVKKSEKPFLPKWSRWQRDFESLENLVSVAHQMLFDYPHMQKWFKIRKIEGFIKQGKFGLKDNWAIFPVFDPNDKIVDVVCRNTTGQGGSKYVLHPDNERVSPYLYSPNWKRVMELDYVYVPYGMVDAWAFEAIGQPVITGTSGKSLNAERLKRLNKKFIMVPDLYEEQEAYHLAKELGWTSSVKRLKYPDDCKDPDEVRRKHGNEKLEELLNGCI